MRAWITVGRKAETLEHCGVKCDADDEEEANDLSRSSSLHI